MREAPVIARHRDRAGFPFAHYYRDAAEHAGAAAYWREVLASVPALSGWQPLPGPTSGPAEGPPDLAEGLMARLAQPGGDKELVMMTASREGVAADVLALNAPMDDEAILDWSEPVGADPAAPQLRGMHDYDALAWAAETYRPFVAFVQPTEAGGERLVMIAEISAASEVLTREAAALFAAPGPAAGRIAARFSGDDAP